MPGPFTMSQQAQDDHYGDPRSVALAYAEACNAEVKDLFAAGADIVQLDEPYMQARPEPARAYGLEALNRALDGVQGTTAVHICFGYAAIIHERPSGYSFLPELADCSCDQVSIETGQSKLDPSVLKHLPDKTIILGVIDLNDHAVETGDGRRRAGAQGVAVRRPGAGRHRSGLRHEVPPTGLGGGEDAQHGRGRSSAAGRARLTGSALEHHHMGHREHAQRR